VPSLLLVLLFAAGVDEPGIQDNSLLTEEAYNQERGVVQHISFFQRDSRSHDWIYTFTQEWPAPGQLHQWSYTLPLQRAGRGARIGDVAVNYRYQLVGDSDAKLAATPRFTVTLPTGDWRRGQGNGAAGFNAAMALSYVPHPMWNLHFDAGATNVPRSRATTHTYQLGNNIVWLPSKRLNLMVETLYQRDDGQRSLLISPAVRWAYNRPGGLQIVPAIGFPIGVGPSAGERSVILYLSFEHPFRR
jgi:hypothetical protein